MLVGRKKLFSASSNLFLHNKNEGLIKNINLKTNDMKNIFTKYFVGLKNVRTFAPDFEREITAKSKKNAAFV